MKLLNNLVGFARQQRDNRELVVPASNEMMLEVEKELAGLNEYTGHCHFGSFDNTDARALEWGVVSFFRDGWTIHLIPEERYESFLKEIFEDEA